MRHQKWCRKFCKTLVINKIRKTRIESVKVRSWNAKEVDARLHEIMENIHNACVKYGTQPDGYVNYVKGANVAGFMKVATAMLEMGVV
jgi:glutamate dehydrogenase/leucine dehydrogenase